MASDSYEAVFEEMQRAGIEVDYDGEQSEEAVCILESLVSTPLPTSYRMFVKKYGFGGAENNPLIEVGESAYYQTQLLRSDWELPSPYLVIFYDYDLLLAICIDLQQRNADGECPLVVVEYRGAGQLDISPEGSSFKEVFLRHMRELTEVQ